jgi:thiol-disulfide isomerase/thioredoxin
MTRLILGIVGISWLLSVAAGCSKDPPPNTNSVTPSTKVLTPPEGNTEPPLDADGGESTVELKLIAPSQYPDMVARQKGKVVLVDFWATWCAPCRKAFPHTVKMHQELASRGLAVMTVSFDDPDSKADAEQFLKEANATFPNYQCNLGDSVKSMDAYQIGDAGIPHYKLYDREGKLVKVFRGDLETQKGVDPHDVEAEVLKLLDAK